MSEEHLTLTTEEVTAFAKEAVQRFIKQYEEGAGGCVMEVEDAQLFAGLLKGLLNHVDDLQVELDEAKQTTREEIRNNALREAMEKCKAVIDTDMCGSGTAYDNGFKAAAQRCFDETEDLIEGMDW